MADLRFIPLVFWHPNAVLVIHWRCGQVLGTQGGDLNVLVFISCDTVQSCQRFAVLSAAPIHLICHLFC
jgi:hypothetical protein